jgi:hypothetical protein
MLQRREFHQQQLAVWYAWRDLLLAVEADGASAPYRAARRHESALSRVLEQRQALFDAPRASPIQNYFSNQGKRVGLVKSL